MKRYQKKPAVSPVGRYVASANLPHRGKPLAYTSRGLRLGPSPFAIRERLTWAFLALACAGVLVLARWLQPDPSGVGTHTQLGLPPCAFLLWTSLPCPGCGLTTSFAHMAHGHLDKAFEVQPLGTLLFGLCVLALPLCLVACVRAWPMERTLTQLHLYPLALGVAALAFLNWCLRVLAIWLA